MSREAYDRLTDATEKVLMGNQKPMAIGWDKAQQYISAILKEDKKDPFAAFESMYEGAAKGNVSRVPWRRRLDEIDEKYTHHCHESECPMEAIREKYHGFSTFYERFMAAMANDGLLDLEETDDLINLLAVIEPLIPKVNKSLLKHKAKLENSGQLSVVSSQR